MEIAGELLAFIFGTIIGSFLNVVAFRYNTGQSINGRSQCLTCGRTLGWAEMVPIVSWVALRGRCRKCSAAISIQYPLVELATGLIFLGIFRMTFIPSGFSAGTVIYGIILAVAWSVLVVIIAYDAKHKIIPDLLVGIFIVLSFVKVVMLYGHSIFSMPYLITGLCAGPIIAAPFVFLWLVSRGKWIGLGDGKLALGIGWFLGLFGAISAILIGFWTGALVSVILLLISRLPAHSRIRKFGPFRHAVTAKTEIPFAPFLILGLALVFFFNLSVLGF